jgi:alkanesulfonate monooxygenase SsuD/methylene tetrahydromethanopterin reductase-like flavin-dependent oxidoreductase (luciferase family)
MVRTMKFGFGVPIFANPGVPYFRTPNLEELDWQVALHSVRAAESLGYDSLWVADHVFLGRDGAVLEGWTTLSALALAAPSLRLGPIHLALGFRHPSLVAKMIATLDVISGGRVEFFVEPGWREREFRAYGFEWIPSRAERVARTEEAIVICRLLWSGEEVSYDGRFFSLDRASCRPTPVQEGGPRVWIGEALDEETLALTARHADVWNSIPASPELLASKIAKVDEACERAGRDPATLKKTLETQVLVYESRDEAKELFRRYDDLRARYPSGDAMSDIMDFLREIDPELDRKTSLDAYCEAFVIGTPEEVAAKLAAYGEMGIDEFICWFMDIPSTRSMELLASQVLPRFGATRSGASE